MATIDVGSGDGGDTIRGVVSYLSSGGSITTLFTSSIAGLIISPIIAGIDIINAVAAFFTTPFVEGADATANLTAAFLDAPANLLESGARISEGALAVFVGESLAGILALPIATAVVLLSLFLVVQFLQEEETGDTLPALPFDVPDIFGLELGVTEEGEKDE